MNVYEYAFALLIVFCTGIVVGICMAWITRKKES